MFVTATVIMLLLLLAVYWSVQCDVEYVVGCSFSSHMAAFVRNGEKVNGMFDPLMGSLCMYV